MMQRSNTLWYIVIMILFMNCYVSADENITMDDIISGLQTRKQVISRLEAHYFRDDYFKKTNNDSSGSGILLEKIQSRGMYVTRKGEKVHVVTDAIQKELKEEKQKYYLQDTFAWDGEKRMGYVCDPNNPNSGASGSIADNKDAGQFKIGYWQTPFEQMVFDLPISLSDLVSNNKDNWSIEGPEKIGQYNAYKLVSNGKPGDNWNAEIWISPDHGFAPVQMKVVITPPKGEPVIEEMRDVVLVNVDGAWVQESSTIEIVNSSQSQTPYIQKVKLDGYKIGHDIPDDMFVIQFPKGTKVLDRIKNIAYIAGEGVIVKNDDGRVELVEYNTLPKDLEDIKNNINNDDICAEINNNSGKEKIIKEIRNDVNDNSTNKYIEIVLVTSVIIFIFIGLAIGFVLYRRGKNGKTKK